VNRKGTPLSGSEPWALSPHPATSLIEIFPQKPTTIRTDNLRHTAPSFFQPIIHNEPTRTKSCSCEERTSCQITVYAFCGYSVVTKCCQSDHLTWHRASHTTVSSVLHVTVSLCRQALPVTWVACFTRQCHCCGLNVKWFIFSRIRLQ
jgi:hypothetical protein